MASPLNRPGLRAAAASAALTLVALSANVPAAQAIPPPSVDPAMVPADARPGPDQPMRRSNSCSTPITVRNPDVAQLAPGFNLVNISKAWQYSTGNGVPVAVIDTGVSPNPRLPVVPGGDYIMGEDGLSDCDAHGTVVSSIIAAAPLGILPMPRAMPATAAFPPPAGPPPVTAAPAPPVEVPPPMPPPPPVTITQTVAPPPPPPEDAGAMAPS
ncbi:type VII secretion-associated serine protease, partial [Mycobacterium tuberculosis]